MRTSSMYYIACLIAKMQGETLPVIKEGVMQRLLTEIDRNPRGYYKNDYLL
jgi:hypothetical protein